MHPICKLSINRTSTNISHIQDKEWTKFSNKTIRTSKLHCIFLQEVNTQNLASHGKGAIKQFKTKIPHGKE